MLCNLPDAERFEVRGVSRYQLKGFIAQMKQLGISAAIYCLTYWVKDISKVPLLPISADSAEQLEKEYID